MILFVRVGLAVVLQQSVAEAASAQLTAVALSDLAVWQLYI